MAWLDARDSRWGVVQLVGHLTVNEDGEGSNPSAPAKFPPFKNDSIDVPAQNGLSYRPWANVSVVSSALSELPCRMSASLPRAPRYISSSMKERAISDGTLGSR